MTQSNKCFFLAQTTYHSWLGCSHHNILVCALGRATSRSVGFGTEQKWHRTTCNVLMLQAGRGAYCFHHVTLANVHLMTSLTSVEKVVCFSSRKYTMGKNSKLFLEQILLLISFYSFCEWIPEINNWRDKLFILNYGSRGFSSWP